MSMVGALMLSTAVQADETGNTVTSGQLREQGRLYAAENVRSTGTGNSTYQGQGAQNGSQTGTAVQTRQQNRTQEQKRLRKKEHAYQGGGSGYGRGYESRGGYGRSGGQGGGRR